VPRYGCCQQAIIAANYHSVIMMLLDFMCIAHGMTSLVGASNVPNA
jgi:hypothetical protein